MSFYQVVSFCDPEQCVSLLRLDWEAQRGEDGEAAGVDVAQVAHERHDPGTAGMEEPARAPVVNVGLKFCEKKLLEPLKTWPMIFTGTRESLKYFHSSIQLQQLKRVEVIAKQPILFEKFFKTAQILLIKVKGHKMLDT